MRYPLFSEIAHGNNPVFDAYEAVYLEGGGKDPLAAAIAAHVKAKGGDPKSPEVKILVQDRVIDALTAQIYNLWTLINDASGESKVLEKLLEEKAEEITKHRVEKTMNEVRDKGVLKDLRGGGDDSGGGG